MNRILKAAMAIFLLTLSFSALAQKAQYKKTDASEKRMPEWVRSVERGYLIATAEGDDIEEAKKAVIENVKQQIANSIATRIISESVLHATYSENGDRTYSTQDMETRIMSRTAKLPFIGEISLSKATDYYWEERRWRSDGKVDYIYAVKYPFSETEMEILAAQYREYDAGLNARIEEFESGLHSVTSVEAIGDTIGRLKVFLDEFDTIDPRYNQVQVLTGRYRDLYNRITLECVQESKGAVAVTLHLSGREISTSQKPVLKSNCATQLTSSIEGNVLLIKYNDEYCYDQDDNYIDIRLRAGNKYISQRVFIEL